MYEQYRGEEVHRGYVCCQMLAAFNQIYYQVHAGLPSVQTILYKA